MCSMSQHSKMVLLTKENNSNKLIIKSMFILELLWNLWQIENIINGEGLEPGVILYIEWTVVIFVRKYWFLYILKKECASKTIYKLVLGNTNWWSFD